MEPRICYSCLMLSMAGRIILSYSPFLALVGVEPRPLSTFTVSHEPTLGPWFRSDASQTLRHGAFVSILALFD